MKKFLSQYLEFILKEIFHIYFLKNIFEKFLSQYLEFVKYKIKYIF